MKANKIVAVALMLALMAPAAIAAPLPPPAFGDGCSGGMSWIARHLYGVVPVWESCCVTHDRAYAKGGTSNSRAKADRALYVCTLAKSGNPLIAGDMLIAVKLLGQPFYPFGWRGDYKHDYSANWWFNRSGAE